MWDSIKDHIPVISAGLAGLLALITLFGKIKMGVSAVKEWFSGMGQLPKNQTQIIHKLNCQEQRLTELEDMWKPNGGASAMDILRRLEVRQMEAEAHSSVLLDHNDIPMFKLDKNGETSWINRAYRRKVGLDLADLQNGAWVNFIHPEDKERVMNDFKEALDHTRELHMDYRFHDRYNQYFTVHVTLNPILLGKELRGWWGFAKVEPIESNAA